MKRTAPTTAASASEMIQAMGPPRIGDGAGEGVEFWGV